MPEPEPKKEFTRRIVLWCGLTVFTGLYFFFATLLIHQTNADRQRSDQQNNIRHAREALAARENPDSLGDFLPHYTDGVVNPLWPWLASFTIDEGESDQDVFFDGRWLNTTLACAGLVIIAVFLSRRLSLFGVFLFLFLAGFGAFVKRGTYFQPEPIYYLLVLACWITVFYIFEHPRPLRFALLGVFSGLAYLAKPSIQILLIVFAGVFALQVAWQLIKSEKGQRFRLALASGGGLALVAITFLVVASPRLVYSHKTFGSAFHSWPSFWMWSDTFEEGAALMAKYQAPGNSPEDERPSFSRYADKNDWEKARARMAFGTEWTLSNFFTPSRAKVNPKNQKPWKRILPDRGWYLLYLTLALGALAAVWFLAKRKKEVDAGTGDFARGWPAKALFVAGVFTAYTLAFSWYAVIGKGDRFLLALYPPLVLTLVWGADALARHFRDEGVKKAVYHLYAAASVVLLFLVISRLWLLTSYPQFYTK